MNGLGVDVTSHWNLVEFIAPPSRHNLSGVRLGWLHTECVSVHLASAPAVRVADVLEGLAIVGPATVPPTPVQWPSWEAVVSTSVFEPPCCAVTCFSPVVTEV